MKLITSITLLLSGAVFALPATDPCDSCVPRKVMPGAENYCENDKSVQIFGTCKPNQTPVCTFLGEPNCEACPNPGKVAFGYHKFCSNDYVPSGLERSKKNLKSFLDLKEAHITI